MPFSIVKRNSSGRFSEVRMHLDFIKSIEPDNETEEHTSQVKILRGLFYVHLYAALEKAINEMVEQSLLLIKNENVSNSHFITAFNVISLYPKMQSFKDSGYKDFFKKSIEVFGSVDSTTPAEINNTLFGTSLQNVWFATLTQVLQCFGIAEFTIDPRIILTVNEVVENRNAIAHGRESPIVVGERHRSDVLRQKTQEIQTAVDTFIHVLETYISERSYIKEHHRTNNTAN